MTICLQDVVRLVTHLPPQLYHAPHLPVPKLWAPSHEKVGRHAFQYRRRQCRRYLLLRLISLCLVKVGIEVPRHQHFGSPGEIFERCGGILYFQCVVGGEVTTDDVPSPLPRFQLKSNNVGLKYWMASTAHRIYGR